MTEECGRYQLYFTVKPTESYYESTSATQLTERLDEDKTAAQMGLECTSYSDEWQCTESNKLEHYTTNSQDIPDGRTLTPCKWCGTACVTLDESCPTTTSTTLAVNSDLSEAYKYLKTAGDTDSLILSSDQETTEHCFEQCRTNDSCRAVDIEQTSTAQVKCRTFNSTIPSDGIGESGTTVFYLKPYFNYKFKKSIGAGSSTFLDDKTVNECYEHVKDTASVESFAYWSDQKRCFFHSSRTPDPDATNVGDNFIFYLPEYFENEDGNQIVFENCNGAYIRHKCTGFVAGTEEIPTNRPDHEEGKTFDYLQDNIESLEACRDLCKSAPGGLIGSECKAFGYNTNTKVCSMHINNRVDDNCGTSTAGFKWYDMRYFDDDNNEVGHGSLLPGTSSVDSLSKIECEQECYRHASCKGITFAVTGDCILLKDVTRDKLLCHPTTDVGSHTISLKASAPFDLLESTFAHTTCHQFRENTPGTVGCASDDEVIKDMTIVFSGKVTDQSCADGDDKDFTENAGCTGNSPEDLEDFALKCCENQAKCTLSCSNSECQCVSTPSVEPLPIDEDPCPTVAKFVSVNVTCGDPPPPAQASASKSSTSSNGLSTGAIVGIAAGSVALVGLVVFRNRKKIKALFSRRTEGANFSQMIKL